MPKVILRGLMAVLSTMRTGLLANRTIVESTKTVDLTNIQVSSAIMTTKRIGMKHERTVSHVAENSLLSTPMKRTLQYMHFREEKLFGSASITKKMKASGSGLMARQWTTSNGTGVSPTTLVLRAKTVVAYIRFIIAPNGTI